MKDEKIIIKSDSKGKAVKIVDHLTQRPTEHLWKKVRNTLTEEILREGI